MCTWKFVGHQLIRKADADLSLATIGGWYWAKDLEPMCVNSKYEV